MRVLIACEFSGIVREAFRRLGHDAWSCDLEPSEIPSGNHAQCDVRSMLDGGWDLMIAHPPCTFLSLSGNRWRRGREQQTEEALVFASTLWRAPIKKIALEQPRSILSSRIGKMSQSIHPFYFGIPEFKETWLWLKGLPKLVPTEMLVPPKPDRPLHDVWSRVHRAAPGTNRWKERSRTLPAVAMAMAEQWSR